MWHNCHKVNLDCPGRHLIPRPYPGFSKFVDRASKANLTPSVAAKSNNYNDNQASDISLLDGRFNAQDYQQTAGPPIELYHRVFADFSFHSRNTDTIPEDVIRLTAKLMRSLSGISVQEKSRDTDTRKILNTILGIGLETVYNQDKTSSDYAALCPTPFHVNAAPLIMEVKGELGLGGSDPSVQSSFSFTRFYVSDEVSLFSLTTVHMHAAYHPYLFKA